MRTHDSDRLLLQLLPHLQHPVPGLPAWTVIPDLLQASLVLHLGTHTEPVTLEDLDAWGLDVHDAWAAAMDNLRARSSPAHWRPTGHAPLVRYDSPDPEGAARLLLLPELVYPFPPGGVLCALPTPRLLIALPAYDQEDASALRSLVAAGTFTLATASHPLTDQLLWTDGEVLRHVAVLHDGMHLQVSAPAEVTAAMDRLAGRTPAAALADA